MGGQGIERREVLRILAIAAGVAAFPGFSKWTFACGHVGNAVTQIKPVVYQPVFFAAHEYALVDSLSDLIIPRDGTPGAREAGAPEFIDLMVSRDPELQRGFRDGLAWIEEHCRKVLSKPWLALSSEQRTGLLEPLAYKTKHLKGEEPGREFFQLIREYTVMGFYTSEIGLKELDFPGLKFFAESPACPHINDREHRHLPTPRC